MESLTMIQRMLTPKHYDKFYQKSWGFEYWFENNDKYCGKIIQVRQGEWSSHGAFHYHKEKDETFLVLSGTLLLDIMILNNVERSKVALKNEITLKEFEGIGYFGVSRYYIKPYNYLRIKPGVLHRFSAYDQEAIFTETSTTHNEEDSYRIQSPCAEEQMEFDVYHQHGEANFPENTDQFSYKYKGD